MVEKDVRVVAGLGGGFFNVPRLNLLNNLRGRVPGQNNLLPGMGQDGGFRAFSVEDDLSLTPEGKPRKPAADLPTEAVEEIPVDQLPRDGDPEKVWDDYFQRHSDVEPAAVRQAVRRLVRAQRFDHVIGLVRAALRHNQPQPWMYEALALAMQAQGRSKEEIERVAMSAVDFAQTPLDLMVTAIYFDRQLGLRRRALELYKQVARLAPLQPEPYIYGLAVAEELGDLEGIQWATVGILSQAWPVEQQDIFERACRVAYAKLEELRKQKRTEDAKRFERALDEALVRDCVIRISWTGQADVDLTVIEPSGAVCSYRSPRSTGGGVMMGDANSAASFEGADGYSETYVCPRGFSGTYRAVLRRVWGNVTGGRVKVEVYTHYWSPKQAVLAKTVELKNDQAVIQFQLADGRRTEPLKEVQLANAALPHLQIRQQVLAQQLNALADPSSAGSFALSRNRPFVAGFVPVVGGGAVGYQPVLTFIPEGTMLLATAVISADRRYVRVEPMPNFQGIAEVNIFNMASGANTQGIGGTGGRGFSGLFGGGGFGGFGRGFGGGFF